MFVVSEVTIQVPFEIAGERLGALLQRGAMNGVCEGAYEGGLTAMVRVGPSSGQRGLSKLVRVCFLEPVRRSATITIPLRWEAAGAAGDLFPVLDADVILTRNGDSEALLALTGSYRPPLGRAGDLLDKAVLHHLASATVSSLLGRLSAVIAQPAPQRPEPGPAPAALSVPPQPATWPGGSVRRRCVCGMCAGQ